MNLSSMVMSLILTHKAVSRFQLLNQEQFLKNEGPIRNSGTTGMLCRLLVAMAAEGLISSWVVEPLFQSVPCLMKP